jgi:hypothetical protein
MTSFVITNNLLSSYYEEHFKEDLDRYSLSEYKYKLDVGVGYNLLKSPYRRSNEEEVLFVALVGFIFAAEEELLLHCPNDKDELKRLINEFGLPWIPAVDRGRDICNFIFEPNIATKDEAVALRDAMLLVEPFMMDKLLSFIRTWDDGNFYKRNNIGFIGAYIGKNLSDALVKTYRKYYDFKGLIGLDISKSKIMNYYENDFLNHFKSYFRKAEQKDGYWKTLFVDYISNHRYKDGNPGNNPSENLIFSGMLLYIYIVQQSILVNADHDVATAFYQCSGWPMVGTGPGGGQDLHPLMMLEYAGLLPLKSESLLFVDTVDEVFSVLRQEFNSILNGRSSMKDNPSSEIFLEGIRQGRIKSNIKKYLDKEEKSIRDLIVKWGDSAKNKCFSFLEENGLTTMIQRKENRID